MHKSQIIKLLKLADRFDRSGKYRESDKITNNLTRLAQYYGNFGVSDTVNRIVPYDDTADPGVPVDYVQDTDPSPLNPADIFKSSWFQVIAGSIVFLLIICILNFFFGIFQKNSEMSDVAAAAAAGKGISFSFFGKK